MHSTYQKITQTRLFVSESPLPAFQVLLDGKNIRAPTGIAAKIAVFIIPFYDFAKKSTLRRKLSCAAS
jgi:hypothetical protein